MYDGVPIECPTSVSFDACSFRAMPKSMISARPVPRSIIRLSGFTSRWTIPRAWA